MVQGVGQRVRALRQDKGLSQARLARQLGLETESSIFKLESERSEPSLPLLLAIADQFDVSLDYLLGLASDNNPPEASDEPDRDVSHHTNKTGYGQQQGAVQLFGAKLQALRQQSGWKQAELASRLSLKSHTHISRIESGAKLPSLAMVVAVAGLFSVSSDALLRDQIPVEAVLSPGPK